MTVVPYGGYKPASSFRIEPYTEYELNVISRDFGMSITGRTTVYTAVQFIDTLFVFKNGQVSMSLADVQEIFWRSDLQVTSYSVSAEEVLADSQTVFIGSYLDARNSDLTERYGSVSVGRTVLGVANHAVLRLTVAALSPEYGRYAFSALPLNDARR